MRTKRTFGVIGVGAHRQGLALGCKYLCRQVILFTAGGALLALLPGCHTTPRYRGDGHIRNTSYWDDGVVYTTQYTIRLQTFDMSTDIQKEFDLGQLSLFREPRLKVCIRLKDPHFWTRIRPSEAKFAAREGWRNTDTVKSTLGYQLRDQSGTVLAQSSKPLKDYVWSNGEFDPAVGREYEIYDLDHYDTRVPKGSKLYLSLSYTGDPALTNRGDFVVLWSWK